MRKKLSVIGLLLALTLLVTACGKKEAKTAEEFTSFAEEKGYTVQDATKTTETNGLATSIMIALEDEYQIEFYVLNDDETGEGVFQNNKQIFEERTSGGMKKTISTKNTNFYSNTCDGTYYVISRVGNSMIYAVVDEKYKDEVKKFIEEFGY